jgi:hypothetical protein
VEKEEVEMKQWRWHDGRGRRFPGGCGDGDWLEQLSRPLLEDDVEEDEDMVKHGENAVHLTSLFLNDVEEDEDMVKHGENAVHLTSLFLERLRLFGM